MKREIKEIREGGELEIRKGEKEKGKRKIMKKKKIMGKWVKKKKKLNRDMETQKQGKVVRKGKRK